MLHLLCGTGAARGRDELGWVGAALVTLLFLAAFAVAGTVEGRWGL